MKTSRTCGRCGTRVPASAPDGLCLVCLLDTATGFEAALGGGSNTPGGLHGSTPPSIPPPSFGAYDILGELGRGGQGVVYRARHRSLGRLVALKTIPMPRLADPRARERFQLEASAASRLDHPNIVPIFEAGEQDGFCFHSMKLIEGETLQSAAPRGLPSGREERWAASVLVKVARAVHHAHQRGILHRDLKPSNILLDREGEPHVADFGLAREIGEESALTLNQALIGTPAYLAPEAAKGGSRLATVASDVFSLGAIFYQLLTGRPPFAGATAADTLRSLQDDEAVRPSKIRADVPSDLETICLKCLEKEPNKRYATAQELADDLERFLGDEPIQARPVSRAEYVWRWGRRNPALATSLAVTLFLLLILGIGGPLAAWRIDRARHNEAAQRALARTEADRARHAAELAAAKELEARRGGYAADMPLAQRLLDDNNRGAALALLDKHRPRDPGTAVLGSANKPESAPTQTSDLRNWEWHYLDGLLRGEQIAVLGRHGTRVTDVAFSPDGRWLASSEIGAAVHVWDARTHELARRLVLPFPEEAKEIFALAFSPDGKILAAGADVASEVYLWEAPSWKLHRVLTNDYRANALAFSPDGRFLAAAGNRTKGGVVIWDIGAWRPVANAAFQSSGILPFGLAFSADSKLLVHGMKDGWLGRWSLETRQELPPIRLREGSSSLQRARFSQDGKWAVTSSFEGGVEVWSLPEWTRAYFRENERLLAISDREDLLATAGGQKLHLSRLSTGAHLQSFSGHLESFAAGAVSPAASLIATGGADQTVRFWPIVQGPARKTRVVFPTNIATRTYEYSPRITADRRHASTVEEHDRTFTVWDAERMESISTHPWPVEGMQTVEVAPSGKMAAIGGSHGELLLMDLATDRIAARTNLGPRLVLFCRFSPDGSRLAVYRRSPLDVPAMQVHRELDVFATENLKQLRSLATSGGSVHSGAFTPDNRYFVYGFWSSLAELADLETGSVAASFRGHRGRIIDVAITPDARLIATASDKLDGDNTIRLWDGRTGREIGDPLRGSWESCEALALSHDGSRLAAGGAGVDVWDLATRRIVQTFRATNEAVFSLAWSPDMRQLTAVSDRSMQAWRAETIPAPGTNTLTEVMSQQASDPANVLGRLSFADLDELMPFLDRMIAGGDRQGLWRAARARARLNNGDLAGAAEDDSTFTIPTRDPRCTPKQIDLTRFYNRLLVRDGMGRVGSDLAGLSEGLQRLGGADFDVRGVAQIAGTSPGPSWLPREIRGIPLNQFAQSLHVVHATSWEAPDGAAVGRYVVRYADGGTRELPIVYGHDTRNWWTVPGEPANTPGAQIVWRGNCPAATSFDRSLRLWKRTYSNPRPDVKMASLDFVSSMNLPAPFLVALTIE